MENKNNDLGAKIAYAALDSVPAAKSDAKEIVGLVKSGVLVLHTGRIPSI